MILSSSSRKLRPCNVSVFLISTTSSQTQCFSFFIFTKSTGFFYLTMGTLWGLNHILFSSPVSLDRFFTSQYIDFVTISGWIETFSTLICAAAGAYLLSLIVERSKKCVDFTFTLYFLHTVVCMFYQVTATSRCDDIPHLLPTLISNPILWSVLSSILFCTGRVSFRVGVVVDSGGGLCIDGHPG